MAGVENIFQFRLKKKKCKNCVPHNYLIKISILSQKKKPNLLLLLSLSHHLKLTLVSLKVRAYFPLLSWHKPK